MCKSTCVIIPIPLSVKPKVLHTSDNKEAHTSVASSSSNAMLPAYPLKNAEDSYAAILYGE